MARRITPVDSDPFGDLVVEAWYMTTKTQREMVVENWNTGDRQYYHKIATLLHLDPDALRLASFLEFGHPSVCKENGRPKYIHYGKLCEMMKKYPVDNCLNSVDNSLKTVDKSVESAVEKNATYPQDECYPQGTGMDSVKLSTYPHFIHRVDVDKIY